MQHHLVFVEMKYFFLCYFNFFLLTWNTFLSNVKLFVPPQNHFLCNTKFLSHSNKNIITCQKIIKLSFLCNSKELISFFVHHNFFIFSFYLTHCQHVDLLRSGPRNKESFNPSFTHLSDIPKHLLSKRCSRKKVSYYLGLIFAKRLRGANILVKLPACFSQILQKLIP